MGVEEFCKRAEHGLNDYFANSDYNELYYDLRNWGESYEYK